MAPATEMFTFYIPDVDCWFWDGACDPPIPIGSRFNNDNVELTYVEGMWWAFRGERTEPDGSPMDQDEDDGLHMEFVCVRMLGVPVKLTATKVQPLGWLQKWTGKRCLEV